MLTIFQLDAHERKHVITHLVAHFKHDLGSFTGALLDLVAEVRECIHDRSDGVFRARLRTILTSLNIGQVTRFVNAESAQGIEDIAGDLKNKRYL